MLTGSQAGSQADESCVVGLGGRMWPVAGRVCMDLTMLALGAPDGPGAEVSVGDEAVLFGVAGRARGPRRAAGTLSYVSRTGLTARVPRVYVGGN